MCLSQVKSTNVTSSACATECLKETDGFQPHLHPGKGDGAAYPGGHHQGSGRKEGYQE